MSQTKRFYNYPNLILYEWHPYHQNFWSSKSFHLHEDWTYKVKRRQECKRLIKLELDNI